MLQHTTLHFIPLGSRFFKQIMSRHLSLQRVSSGAGLRVFGIRHGAVYHGRRAALPGGLLPGLLLPGPTDAGPGDGRDGPPGQGLRGECAESAVNSFRASR